MARIITFLFLIVAPIVAFSQEKPEKQTKTKLEAAKSKMVLRSNTRDKQLLVKDNQHRHMIAKRRQASVNKQQRMMQQRMLRIQRQKIQRQRMMQQRKLRQQSMRNRQMNRRK